MEDFGDEILTQKVLEFTRQKFFWKVKFRNEASKMLLENFDDGNKKANILILFPFKNFQITIEFHCNRSIKFSIRNGF